MVPCGWNFLEVYPLELAGNPHSRTLGKAVHGEASHNATQEMERCWPLGAAGHHACRNFVLEKGQVLEAGEAMCTAGAGCWKAAHAAGA